MSATFHGSTEYIQQPDRREWDKSNGWQTIRSWIGPREGSLTFAQGVTDDGAIKVTVADDGPTSTITASYPDIRDGATVNSETGIEINVTWELDYSDLAKDILSHTYFSSVGSGVKADLVAAKAAVDAGEPVNAAWDTKAQEYYQFLSQGTTDYEMQAPVLRKTVKVAEAAGVKAATTGVGRSGAAPSDCPQVLWDNPTTNADGTSLTWLKKGPRVLDIGKGKFSITQEWVGARWSSILYCGNDSP